MVVTSSQKNSRILIKTKQFEFNNVGNQYTMFFSVYEILLEIISPATATTHQVRTFCFEDALLFALCLEKLLFVKSCFSKKT